jgi:hypothetical protein
MNYKSFLGLCTYYRWFNSGFTTTVEIGDQTHGGEVTFLVNSRSGLLPSTKESSQPQTAEKGRSSRLGVWVWG